MQFEFDGSEGRIGVRVWEHPGARRLVVIAHGYGEHLERYDHVACALRARGAAVFVAHPIQDRTDDELRTLAEGAVDEIVAAVTSGPTAG